MTKKELHRMLTFICDKWKYKLDQVEGDKFRVDVAIKMKDDSWRYQFVYVWIKETEKDSFVFLNSRVCVMSDLVDCNKMLHEAGYCRYASVNILPDTINGVECESLCVSATPHSKVVTSDLLDLMIYDIAFNADYLEKLVTGEDKH